MNEARAAQLLQGQSAMANKVYAAVPIQEEWTLSTIHNALMLTGSVSANIRAIKGCVLDLRDVGLVKESRAGHFQRTAKTVDKPTQLKDVKEVIMPQATPAHIRTSNIGGFSEATLVAAKQTVVASSSDILTELAIEAQAITEEFGVRMRALSARLEEVALVVEAEKAVSAEAVSKFAQLQSLLKGN